MTTPSFPISTSDTVLHAWATPKGFHALVMNEAREERVVAFHELDVIELMNQCPSASDVLTLRAISEAAHEAMTDAVQRVPHEAATPSKLHPYGRRTAALLHELAAREGPESPAGRAARALLRGQEPLVL